jgi:hypothetical protein
MSPVQSNKNSKTIPYNLPPLGISRWQSQQPGLAAIPYSELAESPQAVLGYMLGVRWPLTIAEGWKPIAMAWPFQSDTIGILGALLVQEITTEQIRAASAGELQESLGKRALVLALGADNNPGIILTEFTNIQHDELTANFSETTNLSDVALAAERLMHDPETGRAFTDRLPEDVLGARVTEDMKYARQRRL